MMEDVTAAMCSKANCSCTVRRSDLEVGVSVTSDVNNFCEGRTSATATSKSRLRRIEETTFIIKRLPGNVGVSCSTSNPTCQLMLVYVRKETRPSRL